jgi:hypothetical protein
MSDGTACILGPAFEGFTFSWQQRPYDYTHGYRRVDVGSPWWVLERLTRGRGRRGFAR